ncbi:MAG: hypothetical protein ACOYUZ_00655 [Patescibacteria group bacterium]
MNTFVPRPTSHVQRFGGILILISALILGAGCTDKTQDLGLETQVAGNERVAMQIEDVFKTKLPEFGNAVDVRIEAATSTYARGTVKLGSYDYKEFYARNYLDRWEVLFNQETEIYTCEQLNRLGYPESIISKCEEVENTELTIADAQAIQQSFAEKYNRSIEEIFIRISNGTNMHARGSVQFEGENAGGNFLAAKIDEKWVIVFDGNGSIDCDAVESYSFPESMTEDCN